MTRQHLLASLALVLACGSTADPTKTPTPDGQPTTPDPAQPDPTTPAPKLTMEQALEKHGTERMAAWESKDPAKINALYTADATVAMATEKGWVEMKPKDGDEFHKAYWAAFPDAKMTAVRILAKEGQALVEWAVAGTHTGAFMGHKETGKKIGYRGASVLWFADDGKVKREHVYVDNTTMAGQIGMTPKGTPFRAAEPLPTTPPEMVMAKAGDDNSAIFNQMIDFSVKKDLKALGALLADDAVASFLYMPKDDKGKKAIEKNAAEGSKSFSEDKLETRGCMSAGEYVACETTWTAKWTGPMMGMKANNKTGTVHGLDILKIKDGKIVQWTAYGNGMEFAAAFGLMGDASGKKQ